MHSLKTLALAALSLVALQANAGYVTSGVLPVPPGDYTAPTFSGSATVETGSVINEYLQPVGTSGSYMVVTAGGAATVSAGGASSFGFVWGSPDVFNKVTVFGSDFTVSYSGADMLVPADGENDKTFLFNIAGTNGSTIDSLLFESSGVAFEVAVAAVPEPETYALMLAGLGIVGFIARRRRAV